LTLTLTLTFTWHARFKSNFATLDAATGVVTSRRADRRFEDLGPVLCDHLNGAQSSLSSQLMTTLRNLCTGDVGSGGRPYLEAVLDDGPAQP